ncbi:hypothetical protein C6P63_31895 [Burkholderia cenocepacia]|nr:hypothetical protein C6P63_31895 [Burkholderia cenocepacia]
MAQGTHRRIVSFHGGPALSGKADWHVEHLKANRPRGWPGTRYQREQAPTGSSGWPSRLAGALPGSGPRSRIIDRFRIHAAARPAWGAGV